MDWMEALGIYELADAAHNWRNWAVAVGFVVLGFAALHLAAWIVVAIA